MKIISDEEDNELRIFRSAFNNLLLFECHKRCPDNHGYEEKCANCDVCYLQWVVSTIFKMKAQEEGLHYAIRWLIGEEHNQFKDDPKRNRNIC